MERTATQPTTKSRRPIPRRVFLRTFSAGLIAAGLAAAARVDGGAVAFASTEAERDSKCGANQKEPCYGGKVENELQLRVIIYEAGQNSNNNQFNTETDITRDPVVGEPVKIVLATGQTIESMTDEDGWLKDKNGSQRIKVTADTQKDSLIKVELPNGTEEKETYWATRATITTYKYGSNKQLLPKHEFEGLVPLYKEGLNFNPDTCGRVWVIGTNINDLTEAQRATVGNNPQTNPAVVHPLTRKF